MALRQNGPKFAAPYRHPPCIIIIMITCIFIIIITEMPDDSQAVGRNGRVKIEFSVNEKLGEDKFGDPMTVHQAFIRCLSYINYEAVTFIAEAKDGKYSAQCKLHKHFVNILYYLYV